jgi:Tetratricopeptide repeat
LLVVVERVLGREHPDTLRTRLNFAIRTGQAGEPAAARDLLTALLPAVERVLGPEHSDTLRTRDNLAYWTQTTDGEKG